MRFSFSRLRVSRVHGLLVLFVGLTSYLVVAGPRTGVGPRTQSHERLAARLDELFSVAADEVRRAVVAVGTTEMLDRHDPAAGEGFPGDPWAESLGTGFIIDPRGYILTNHHLVGSARSIQVVMSGGRELRAFLVQSDPTTDVALIKVDAERLPALELGNSDRLLIGQWVLAIGNPFGLKHAVSAGIVSGLGRSELHLIPHESFIQTDASINPGNSGGPLVNLRGEVVGINTAMFATSGRGGNGIGFAVPVNLARALAEQWMEGKSAGYLGIVPRPVDGDMAEYFGLEKPWGVFVKQVDVDGPAFTAGLRAMDVITAFRGVEVRDVNHLLVLVAGVASGREADVEVLRDGERRQVRIRLGPRGPAPDPAPLGSGHDLQRTKLLGLTVAPLTESFLEHLGAVSPLRGMLVVQVNARSAAWRKGLRPGDVITDINESAVHELSELHEALGKTTNAVALHVYRGGADLGWIFLRR